LLPSISLCFVLLYCFQNERIGYTPLQCARNLGPEGASFAAALVQCGAPEPVVAASPARSSITFRDFFLIKMGAFTDLQVLNAFGDRMCGKATSITYKFDWNATGLVGFQK
jgi:hypothetical protein